jgi:type I restriction-modification system DNA methylase subunit
MEIEKEIESFASEFAEKIKAFCSVANNEAEFRSKVTPLIEVFASKINLTLHLREEYTLLNGRADAVYNRLVIEYEPPRSLRQNNNFRTNLHSIDQVKTYINDLVRIERQRPERLAGVVLDGDYFIFMRLKGDEWYIDPPLKVSEDSSLHFLKLLSSLATEQALIPENLTKDFGENTVTSRKMVSSLYNALTKSTNPKVKTLFKQWSLQFGEVSDYEVASKIKVDSFARRFGIISENIQPFDFFFCLHTYYATFIKLLAVQIVQYYAMPKFGTDLKKATNFESEALREYLRNLENGGIFRELGIINFIEGDFFSWYLEDWNDEIFKAFNKLISTLSNYSLVTLDVDPETTRDLLKQLYQQLMPKELRHNLGEYYTPDWLAERLLNMVDSGDFKGDPDKRVLDPACGSGTFLVLTIKKMREYGWKNLIPESKLLEKILSNVVGFDLNPLAVISARTNYLLALGDLLQYRSGDINIPVYICDSIMTPSEGEGLYESNIVKFNTAVGPFSVPKSLIQANYIDILSNFLEEAVKLSLNSEQFTDKLCQKLPLNPEQDRYDIEVIYKLYDQLLTLERAGINGIWARVIKNAFAPLFVGRFDFVIGNPPWVNWENLPENYRNNLIPLYENTYGLFPHSGIRRMLGSSRIDISTLMTYVSLDKYLRKNGILGFVITQAIFKTDAGKGFRKFVLPNDIYVSPMYIDDMVELKPFEGVGNRTSVVILQKNKKAKYPVPYNYWTKKATGKSIKDGLSLDAVVELTTFKKFYAEPVDQSDLTSPWISGRPKALKAVRKILGQSEYIAHEGVNSGGANAVYWVDIIDERKDGLVIISNITEGAKKTVENIQMVIEPDLLYPLLRPRDLVRWRAEPSAFIITPQNPDDIKHGMPEFGLKTRFPKTFLYLQRFREILKERAAYIKYLKDEPFYSLYDIKNYTFARYKVVWTRIAKLEAAVVSEKDEKAILPQETITLVPTDNKDEAYYLAAMVNSTPFQFTVNSYSQGKSLGSAHVIDNIKIPKFDSENGLHLKLAQLSEEAHKAAAVNDEPEVKILEEEIDKTAAQIWGLTTDELRDLKDSLEEIL